MTRLVNIIARAAAIGAVVLCAFSCVKETHNQMADQVGHDGARVVHFTAKEIDSKAVFGEADQNGSRPTLWTANDTELKLSLNYGSALAAGIEATADGSGASFDATIDFTGIAAPYTFYAVSPSSAARALSPSREAWKVSIPCEQTPTTLSVDEGAIIVAASSDPYGIAPEAVEMSFDHLTAYGRMSLTNLDLDEGEGVRAVELTCTTPIVGDWYWKCEPEEGGHTLIDYGASSTLTINTSRTTDIWFGCAPVDVSGEMMYVRVYTSLGLHEQLVEFSANRKFVAGNCAVFSVDMDGADFTAAGSGSGGGSGGNDVVLLSEEFDNSTTSDSSTEFSSSKFSNFSGSTSKAYTSQYGGVKLGSSSASGYITSKSLDLSNSFTVTLNVLKYGSDTGKIQITVGNVTKEITPTTTNTAYSLDFEAATSASTVKIGTSSKRAYIDNVIITRHDGGSGGLSSEDPLLQESVYGCWLGSGLEWEYNPGTDQVTRSYDSSGVLTYTIIRPSTVEELEITGYSKAKLKGESFSVSVNWRRGRSTVHNGSYEMTIIKDDGPKVWLGNGSGKGFIIKK